MANWRRLALQSMLVAFGEVPHPSANMRSLETAVKTALVRISNGNESDPEIPDGLLQVLLPALKARGLTDESVVTVVENVNALVSSPGGGVGAPPGWSGVVAPAGSSPEEAESMLSQIGKGLLLGVGGSFGVTPGLSADAVPKNIGTIMNLLGSLLG